MKTIKDIDLKGKKVLVRVDFNVPLDDQGNITDDTRIRAVLPTINYILDAGAALIIMSHLGRPKGKRVEKFSLAPAAGLLEKLLDREVSMADDCVGASVSDAVAHLCPGAVLLLENLRFHDEETKNDDAFAAELASLCEVYISDAFSVSHRKHASVYAICNHAPVCAAGFQLLKELKYFADAMENPKRPLVAIVGGAKVSSKLRALENMLSRVNKIIVGGAMANTFLKSMGYDMGKSLVEDDLVKTAGDLRNRAMKAGISFYLPVDAVVATSPDEDAACKLVPVQEIPSEWMALDIGPATSKLFSEALVDAKTIVWNGPMGMFEKDAYARGTLSMVDSVANAHALSIVGGGDTDVAIHASGLADRISYISTGGGAFLTLLEGKTLPAVAALEAAGT
ncbi:MAG: phosphoglycerate kinase [Deltaproteobacteria bacterium]|nr:phosphoglycerate kinase [Deltaproteobacteria bacterium]